MYSAYTRNDYILTFLVCPLGQLSYFQTFFFFFLSLSANFRKVHSMKGCDSACLLPFMQLIPLGMVSFHRNVALEQPLSMT